jgi:hypothetical protein
MVDIDPLILVEQTYLRCFVEVGQDKLVRYLRVFLGYLNYRDSITLVPEG